MSRSAFRIAYVGEALNDGAMDIVDLAPALLGIGDMFTQANRLINGERSAVRVVVKSDFERGSFIVTLQAEVVPWLEKAKDFLLIPSMLAAGNLAQLLGFLGADAPGLLQLIKRCGGKSLDVKRVLPDDGRIEVSCVGDDNTILVGQQVLLLYDNQEVRAAAGKALRPLRLPGIEALRFGPEKELRDEIKAIDVAEFLDPPVEQRTASQSPQREVSSESIRMLHPVKAWLRRDRTDNKWTLSDGPVDYSADMDDDAFVNAVNTSLIGLFAGTILTVRFRTTTENVGGTLVTRYSVTEVLDSTTAKTWPGKRNEHARPSVRKKARRKKRP